MNQKGRNDFVSTLLQFVVRLTAGIRSYRICISAPTAWSGTAPPGWLPRGTSCRCIDPRGRVASPPRIWPRHSFGRREPRGPRPGIERSGGPLIQICTHRSSPSADALCFMLRPNSFSSSYENGYRSRSCRCKLIKGASFAGYFIGICRVAFEEAARDWLTRGLRPRLRCARVGGRAGGPGVMPP